MKLEKGQVFQYVEDGYSFTVTDVEVDIGNPVGMTVKVNVEYSDGTTGVSFAEHIHLLLRGGDLEQVS